MLQTRESSEEVLATDVGVCIHRELLSVDDDHSRSDAQCIIRASNFAKAKEEQARFQRALKIDQQREQQEGRRGE